MVLQILVANLWLVSLVLLLAPVVTPTLTWLAAVAALELAALVGIAMAGAALATAADEDKAILAAALVFFGFWAATLGVVLRLLLAVARRLMG